MFFNDNKSENKNKLDKVAALLILTLNLLIRKIYIR